MLYSTNDYSLRFWRDFHARLTEEVVRVEQSLKALTEGIPTTIDTLKFSREEMVGNNQKFFKELQTFHSLVNIKSEISEVLFNQELLTPLEKLKRELNWLDQMVSTYTMLFSDLPSRDKINRRLDYLAATELELKNQGHNEQLAQERAKLKNNIELLCPVAKEDSLGAQARLQVLLAEQSEKRSELELLTTSVKFSLVVTAPDTADALRALGLSLRETEEVQVEQVEQAQPAVPAEPLAGQPEPVGA